MFIFLANLEREHFREDDGLVWIYFDVLGNLEWMGVWWALSVGRVKYKPKYRWDLEIVL